MITGIIVILAYLLLAPYGGCIALCLNKKLSIFIGPFLDCTDLGWAAVVTWPYILVVNVFILLLYFVLSPRAAWYCFCLTVEMVWVANTTAHEKLKMYSIENPPQVARWE